MKRWNMNMTIVLSNRSTYMIFSLTFLKVMVIIIVEYGEFGLEMVLVTSENIFTVQKMVQN
jgi:hypothetical protein